MLSKLATHDNSAYPGLWRGCVGAWCPSLGPSGSRLFDYSRQQNWGTLTNMDPATDWVVSDGQYALDFDGVNDSVVIGRPAVIDATIDFFTLAVWARPTSFGALRNIIGKANNTAGQFGIILDGAGNWSCQFGFASNVSGAALATNKWYLLAYNLQAGAVRTFTNGKLSVSGSNTTQTIAVDFEIGRDTANNRNFAGQIDDVFFWRRVLSDAEIRQLYQIGRGGMFTPRHRRLAPSEQAAGGATPWLYARRSSRIIGGGVS